jgi:hypothetical protein
MNLATATMADNSTVKNVRIIISGPREASGTTTWSCLTHHRSIRGEGAAKRKRRSKSEFGPEGDGNKERAVGNEGATLIVAKRLFDQVVILGDL